MCFKRAFTLIELVFCVVIISILTFIAIPYFSFSKSDAKVVKLKSDVELINASLALLKNQFIFQKRVEFPKMLDNALVQKEKQELFYCDLSKECFSQECCMDKILDKAIISSKNGWMKITNTKYRFFINSKKYIDFSYNFDNVFLECISLNCKDYGF